MMSKLEVIIYWTKSVEDFALWESWILIILIIILSEVLILHEPEIELRLIKEHVAGVIIAIIRDTRYI